jgi:hypothetical protein
MQGLDGGVSSDMVGMRVGVHDDERDAFAVVALEPIFHDAFEGWDEVAVS